MSEYETKKLAEEEERLAALQELAGIVIDSNRSQNDRLRLLKLLFKWQADAVAEIDYQRRRIDVMKAENDG